MHIPVKLLISLQGFFTFFIEYFLHLLGNTFDLR